MKHGIRSGVGLLLLIITLFNVPHANSQAGKFRFAYATYSSAFPASSVTIYTVDPANPGDQKVLFTVPVPDYTKANSLSFKQAIPSPDGKWLAMLFDACCGSGGVADKISVVNVATGASRDVTDYPFILTDDDGPMLEPFDPIVWSPDSRYLAINMWLENGKIAMGGNGPMPEDSKLNSAYFLYSIDAGTLINSAPDAVAGSWAARISWSRDSSKFVVATANPTPNHDGAIHNLDVYDVATMKRHTQITVPTSPSAFSLVSGLCYLAWSPDGQNLSFIMDCDPSEFSFMDVFVADVETDKVTKLTNFKTTLDIPLKEFAGSIPEPLWIDDNTLLVSVEVWRGEGGKTHTEAFIEYQWPSGTPTIVGSQWFVGLARNPVSQEIAYFVQTFSLDTSSINGNYAINSLQIGKFEAGKLTAEVTVPANGGWLQWSPDGSMLADIPWLSGYVIYQDEKVPVTYLWDTTFIDQASERITRFTPPADKHTQTFSVGWVYVS